MGALIHASGLAKVYGSKPERALGLLAEGRSRQDVQDATGTTVAVRDVDLSVERGELFVLMGLSGSGKSTVLRMLNGLVEPTAGSVEVDGRDIAALDAAELRRTRNRQIAMVFQHFALFPHRTVRQNAGYGLSVRGAPAKELLERVDWALDVVGLGAWGDRRPGELSGGMQQRVALARGLATDADVLLMDEPFSALDPLIRRDMQDLLMKLRDEIDRTIVFVTHDLNEAMRLGDRICLLEDGTVAQTGTTAEILSRPANDYVARFIGEVDRLKVLTARDVMQHSSGNGAAAADRTAEGRSAVEAGTSLDELCSRFDAENRTLTVVDGGRVLGTVDGERVLQAATTRSKVAA